MNAKEVLTEAARLLWDVGWTQGCLARDSIGLPAYLGEEGVSCFCMVGAILLASQNDNRAFEDAMDKASIVIGRTRISHFNDTPGRIKVECIAKLLEAAEL